MPLAFFSDLSRNLLLRTLIATAAVFLFLGFATGALPVKCLTQALTSCGAVPSVAPGGTAEAAPLRFAPLQAQAIKVAEVTTQGPTLSDNDVVSDSFALLHYDTAPPAPLATTWKSTAASDENPLASRTVKTVAIHADGTPEALPSGVPETPATAVAEASPTSLPTVAPLVAPPRDDSAAAAIDAAAPAPETAKPAPVADKLALVEEPAPPKARKASPAEKMATVSGQGANVHDSAKSSSGVLFALTGGTKVTVLDDSHGWVHITDAKGRSGWMYKDYLS